MGVLVLPRSPGIRPATGARLHRGHSLAHGLVAAFLFNEGPGCVDLVTRNVRLVPSSGTSFGELGLHALAADRGAEIATPTALQLGLPHSIAAFFTFRGTPAANSLIFGIPHNNTDASPFQSTALASDGFSQVAWRGNNAGSFVDLTTGVTGASLVNVPSLAVATLSATARAVWLNGVLKGSTSGAYSAPTYGASSMLAGGDYAGVSRNSNLILHAGFIWNRQLTTAEILTLSAQPYSPIQATSLMWGEPVVGGVGVADNFFAFF